MESESLPAETAELSPLLAQLRTANSGLREVVAGQATQIEILFAQVGAETARIAELERRLARPHMPRRTGNSLARRAVTIYLRSVAARQPDLVGFTELIAILASDAGAP